MFIFHTAHGQDTWSIAFANPDPSSPDAYDLGIHEVIRLEQNDVVSFAGEDGVFFGAEMQWAARQPLRKVNPGKLIPMRKRSQVSTEFVTGYTQHARRAAEFWRENGVGPQPVLAAGVFAAASIRTTIKTCLKFTNAVVPYLLEDQVPDDDELTEIIRKSGVAFPIMRKKLIYGMVDYRHNIVEEMSGGLLDDALRHRLAVEIGNVPSGLGLAKLSFILALIGNNTGCLDARILGWAMGKEQDNWRKNTIDGYSESMYQSYRALELEILTQNPFYDEKDPLGIARSQWMLWESLGPDSQTKTHTHRELYEALVDGRLDFNL